MQGNDSKNVAFVKVASVTYSEAICRKELVVLVVLAALKLV